MVRSSGIVGGKRQWAFLIQLISTQHNYYKIAMILEKFIVYYSAPPKPLLIQLQVTPQGGKHAQIKTWISHRA
jgi:hypothetical protein